MAKRRHTTLASTSSKNISLRLWHVGDLVFWTRLVTSHFSGQCPMWPRAIFRFVTPIAVMTIKTKRLKTFVFPLNVNIPIILIIKCFIHHVILKSFVFQNLTYVY